MTNCCCTGNCYRYGSCSLNIKTMNFAPILPEQEYYQNEEKKIEPIVSEQWKQGSAKWRRFFETQHILPHPEASEEEAEEFFDWKNQYIQTGKWPKTR